MAVLHVLLVLSIVFLNGFFVAAEFALVKVRLSQVEQMARRGHWSAKIAQNLLAHMDAYLSACQLGVTLASLALGWVGESFVASLLEPVAVAVGFQPETAHYFAIPVAFVVITFLHITLGEQAPKIFAIRSARATTLAVALPLAIFFKIFWPFIWLLNHASNLLVRGLGIKLSEPGEQTHTEEELRLILAESVAGGEVSRRERLMMENVLDLENKVARQVMVPRRDIVYLNARDPIDENLQLVSSTRHTRFPLCDGDLDRVIGMVHAKDLLVAITNGEEAASLVKLARKLPFLPETMRLDVMLREFQRNRTHVAIVVDEFGTVSGMVTFENVLEELVGPIQDEFDRELPQVIRRGDGRYLVDATCPLYDLAEDCHIELPPDISADTTGGMMVELLGHIPQAGEKVRIGRHEITIIDAEPTRVRRVEVLELEPEPRHALDSHDEYESDTESAEAHGRPR
jgi:CBS domain containing-hemolysin-like protein